MIFKLFIFIIIYFSFTVDVDSLNILNPRAKFYNIELRQHRLIFITSYILLISTTKNCNEIGYTKNKYFHNGDIQFDMIEL
ncbi:hypothetical protein BLOT_016700 [Blomia tropicalis]|nr:hypothetical protein BLOT_016700 [Blomia tropicalis]